MPGSTVDSSFATSVPPRAPLRRRAGGDGLLAFCAWLIAVTASPAYAAKRNATGDSGAQQVLKAIETYERGDRVAARTAFTQALRRPLDGEYRSIAQTYLELISLDEERSSPWSGHIRASLGGGFDDNVRQAPVAGQEYGSTSVHAPPGSAFASATVALGGGRRLSDTFQSELEYTFYQVAYAARAHDGSSFQDHGLEWMNQFELTRWLRLRVPLAGNLSLTGLRDSVSPFLATLAVTPDLTMRLGQGNRLRAGIALSFQRAIDPLYEAVAGSRRELFIAQDLTAWSWTLSVAGKLRDEDVGESRRALGTLPDGSICPGCEAFSVNPYAYQSGIASLRLSAPWAWVIRPALSASWEQRHYESPAYLTTDTLQGPRRWDARRRHDLRAIAGATVTVRLTGHLELAIRYDVARNRSNMQGSGLPTCASGDALCHPFDSQDRNYVRQTFGLELSAEWM